VIIIIITWLYNKTNGSLLAAALFFPAGVRMEEIK